MKIYAMNLDMVPYHKELFSLFKEKNFTPITEITQCATHTTLISMFTGKSSTDLLDNGIGYRTELKHQKDGHISFPFRDSFIFNILYKYGWDVKF